MTLRIRSWLYTLVSFGLLILSIYAFYNKCSELIPLGIIICVNIYLLSLLFVAAIISDSLNPIKHIDKLNIYPNRVASLVIMLIYFGIFTFSFAALYNHGEWKSYPFPSLNSFDCIYASFISLTTLSVDGIAPDTINLKRIMMLEVFSSLNIFIGSISLLLSRLSNF